MAEEQTAPMMFDWLPEPKWLSWTILLALCFGYAALWTFAPCQLDSIPVIGWIESWGRTLGGNTPVC